MTRTAMTRYEFLDVARGVILIIMSLDHANIFWHCRAMPMMERRWQYHNQTGVPYDGDFAESFTRQISHLCAPGFALIMGWAMLLTTNKRSAKDWSYAAQMKEITKRGFFTSLTTAVPEGFGFSIGKSLGWNDRIPKTRPQDRGGMPFGILAALMSTMFWSAPLMFIICSKLKGPGKRRARTITFSIVGFLLCAVAWSFDLTRPMSETTKRDTSYPADIVYRYFAAGGPTVPKKSWYFSFPVLLLAGPAFWGMAFANEAVEWLKDGKRQTMRRALTVTGCSSVLAFFIVRGIIVTDPMLKDNGVVGFFAVRKYPFSIEFLLWNIGWFLIIIAACDVWFERVKGESKASALVLPTDAEGSTEANPSIEAEKIDKKNDGTAKGAKSIGWIVLDKTETIGKVPAFYYVAHLNIFAVLALSVSLGEGQCVAIWWPYLVTIAANYLLMDRVCRWFFDFKVRRGPKSVWRFW